MACCMQAADQKDKESDTEAGLNPRLSCLAVAGGQGGNCVASFARKAKQESQLLLALVFWQLPQVFISWRLFFNPSTSCNDGLPASGVAVGRH